MAAIMRKYECMLIAEPVKAAANWDDTRAEIENILKKNDLALDGIRRFGERRLAYTIRKNLNKYDRGCYILVHFSGDTSKIAKFKRDISLSDTFLRAMVLKLEKEDAMAGVPENFEFKDSQSYIGA